MKYCNNKTIDIKPYTKTLKLTTTVLTTVLSCLVFVRYKK